MDGEDFKKIRDLFREEADLIDKMLDLKAKSDEGQDVEKEFESVFGSYAIKMMEIASISDK